MECTGINGALASLSVIVLEPSPPENALKYGNYADQNHDQAVEIKAIKKHIERPKDRKESADTAKKSHDFHANLDLKHHAAGYVGANDVVDTADNSCLSLLLILLLNKSCHVHRMLVGWFVTNRFSIKRRVILLVQLIMLLNLAHVHLLSWHHTGLLILRVGRHTRRHVGMLHLWVLFALGSYNGYWCISSLTV